MARIGNGLFNDYNPYTTLLSGDWYYSEMPLHTGEVYLDGKSMYEMDSLEAVLHPARNRNSACISGTPARRTARL